LSAKFRIIAGNAEADKQVVTQSFGGRFGRKDAGPDFHPQPRIRKCKLNVESDLPQERLIQLTFQIRRENGVPLIRLHARQRTTHLDVGVIIVVAFDRAALTEQRIRFIKERRSSPVLL